MIYKLRGSLSDPRNLIFKKYSLLLFYGNQSLLQRFILRTTTYHNIISSRTDSHCIGLFIPPLQFLIFQIELYVSSLSGWDKYTLEST